MTYAIESGAVNMMGNESRYDKGSLI